MRTDVPCTSEEDHTLKTQEASAPPLGARRHSMRRLSKVMSPTQCQLFIDRAKSTGHQLLQSPTQMSAILPKSRRNGGRCHRLNVSYSSHLVTSHYPSETAQIIRDVTDSMSAIRLKQSVRRPNTGGPRATLKCATPKWPTEMSTTCV